MVSQVNHRALARWLKKAHELRCAEKSVPLFIHGTFGIGKSDAVKAFAQAKAKELGLRYSEKKEDVNKEDVFLVLNLCLIDYQAEELKGVIYPKDSKAEFLPLGILPEKGQGIIFLDDFNNALPSVQSAAYQLVENRRVGGYRLPDGFSIVAAGNKASDGAYTFDMPPPILNRFIHVELKVPTPKEWVDEYAVPHGLDSRIILYVLYKNVVHNYDPENSQEFPVITPRSLEKASILIRDIPDEDEENLLIGVGMALGSPVAHEFVAWLKLSRKYDIPALYKSRKLELPEDFGELYSLILAIVNYYSQNKTQYNAGSIGMFCKAFQDNNKGEFAAAMLALIKRLFQDNFLEFLQDMKKGLGDERLYVEICENLNEVLGIRPGTKRRNK